MADFEKNKKTLEDLEAKSAIGIYGTNSILDRQEDSISKIIQNTSNQVVSRYGDKNGSGMIDSSREMDYTNIFGSNIKSGDDAEDSKSQKSKKDSFKELMSSNQISDANAILLRETNRTVLYSNFTAIHEHIPECSQSLDIFKNNIMSPDDFTKMMFNVDYDTTDEALRAKVRKKLNDITEKYDVEEIADQTIGESLKLGDQYIAVLSLEDDMGMMLNDPMFANGILTESDIRAMDPNTICRSISPSDVMITESESLAFEGGFSLNEGETVTMQDIQESVSDFVNVNVKIGSKYDFLYERMELEKYNRETTDVESNTSMKKGKKQKKDNKPLGINGSSIKILDPSKVVELKVDNVVYGYYHIEESQVPMTNGSGYIGNPDSRQVNTMTAGVSVAMNTDNSKFKPMERDFDATKLSDDKLAIVGRIFAETIAKKIDKSFVRNNKQFKEFIYSLVKQKYLLHKQINMTFFTPDEIVAFKVPPLYRKIVFFSRLYLAMLTNIILIKMGREHDKRVYYLDVGPDGDADQTISKFIQDIKTREFKMDSINDINTILTLAPGRFHDLFIPTYGGDSPVNIDTIPGMNADMSNDFIEYLKNSMITGIGLPRNIIDTMAEVDFARTFSAQNSNFVRDVIKYQKKFTAPFKKLYQLLYRNEYRFNSDGLAENLDDVLVQDIKVSFPSPASLNMTNLAEQLQSADVTAEMISNALVPQDPQDPDSDLLRAKLKCSIIKKNIPGITWDEYEETLDELKERMKKDIEAKKLAKTDEPPMF